MTDEVDPPVAPEIPGAAGEPTGNAERRRIEQEAAEEPQTRGND